MERIISVRDFDPCLQEWYEQTYGVHIAYEQTPDGDYSLSISGDELDLVVEDLSSLSQFQAKLATHEMQQVMQGLISHFTREINNPGGKLN